MLDVRRRICTSSFDIDDRPVPLAVAYEGLLQSAATFLGCLTQRMCIAKDGDELYLYEKTTGWRSMVSSQAASSSQATQSTSRQPSARKTWVMLINLAHASRRPRKARWKNRLPRSGQVFFRALFRALYFTSTPSRLASAIRHLPVFRQHGRLYPDALQSCATLIMSRPPS